MLALVMMIIIKKIETVFTSGQVLQRVLVTPFLHNFSLDQRSPFPVALAAWFGNEAKFWDDRM